MSFVHELRDHSAKAVRISEAAESLKRLLLKSADLGQHKAEFDLDFLLNVVIDDEKVVDKAIEAVASMGVEVEYFDDVVIFNWE